MAKACSSCRHWTRLDNGPSASGPARGRCQEQPPTPTVVAMKMDAQTGIFSVVGIDSMFPTAYADWFCGKHTPKLELAS